MLKAVVLCFMMACCVSKDKGRDFQSHHEPFNALQVLGEEVCKKGEKKILQRKPKIVMRCDGKGEWNQEKQRSAPGGPPCTDSPAMNNTCPAERGHCLQYTQKGAKMDADCPGTCGMYDNKTTLVSLHLHHQILVMVAVAKTTTSGTCIALTGNSTVTVQGGWLDV